MEKLDTSAARQVASFRGSGGKVIRPAVPSDAEALLLMGHSFWQEAGHAESTGPFEPTSFLGTLELLANAGLLLVTEENGKVVGMAGADLAPAFWNRSILLGREAFWFIMPDHRKGLGRPLLDALEEAAKKRGASFFDVVAEDGKRSEALARLYRAASYIPAERTFRKRLIAEGVERCP